MFTGTTSSGSSSSTNVNRPTSTNTNSGFRPSLGKPAIPSKPPPPPVPRPTNRPSSSNSNGGASSSRVTCQEGSSWRTTCNSCQCSKGQHACTKLNCDVVGPLPKFCTIGSRWLEGCIIYGCSDDEKPIVERNNC